MRYRSRKFYRTYKTYRTHPGLTIEPAASTSGKKSARWFVNAGEVAEAHRFAQPRQSHGADRAVAVFSDDDVGLAGAVFGVVGRRTMQEQDHVGVLLDR